MSVLRVTGVRHDSVTLISGANSLSRQNREHCLDGYEVDVGPARSTTGQFD